MDRTLKTITTSLLSLCLADTSFARQDSPPPKQPPGATAPKNDARTAILKATGAVEVQLSLIDDFYKANPALTVEAKSWETRRKSIDKFLESVDTKENISEVQKQSVLLGLSAVRDSLSEVLRQQQNTAGKAGAGSSGSGLGNAPGGIFPADEFAWREVSARAAQTILEHPVLSKTLESVPAAAKDEVLKLLKIVQDSKNPEELAQRVSPVVLGYLNKLLTEIEKGGFNFGTNGITGAFQNLAQGLRDATNPRGVPKEKGSWTAVATATGWRTRWEGYLAQNRQLRRGVAEINALTDLVRKEEQGFLQVKMSAKVLGEHFAKTNVAMSARLLKIASAGSGEELLKTEPNRQSLLALLKNATERYEREVPKGAVKTSEGK